MQIGSLFSGIGGFELGLQRGLGSASVAWQVEIDPWCRQVLARHWPDAARHDDVRTVGANNLAPVDVLCGGFPCQDISTAGAGAGLSGARSGLWFEMLRIVTELRPRYVVAENVAALRSRGLPVVLAGLRDAGYAASWAIISAADLGAPHQRRRLWIVAYRRGVEPVTVPAPDGARDDVWPRGGDPEPWERGEPRTTTQNEGRRNRLHALGNAVVPQVPELIGQAIADAGRFRLVAPQAADGAWLPTPTATQYGSNAGGANPGHERLSLDSMARGGRWATPKASDVERGGRVDLLMQVRGNPSPSGRYRVWPTACAHNAKGAPGAGSREKGGRQSDLCAAVRWATPSASDDRDRGQLGKTPAVDRRAAAGKQIMLSMQAQGPGSLSPRWVELLMGYPLDWTVP